MKAKAGLAAAATVTFSVLQLCACDGTIDGADMLASDSGAGVHEPDAGTGGHEPDAGAGELDGSGSADSLSACGDGMCDQSEDCESCAVDCGACSGAFSCLDTAAEVEVVTGHHELKYEPDTALGKAFDARSSDFLIYQVKWGMIQVEGESIQPGMCWAGGFVQSDKPWDASWADHKDTDTPDGPTRNSAAISNASYEMTVTGMDVFNVHDGFRTTDGFEWVVQHSWAAYVRDDCVENDHLHSGRIYDCLFDGCYTGISTRPSSSDSSSDGAGEVVELDRVLLRIQAMPYPYEWETKSGVIDENGDPYAGDGIPYGHGNLFKLDSDTSRNPHFVIENSVFLATHYTTDAKLDFPPESLVDGCENNTIIWLGPGVFPGRLPTDEFPDCGSRAS